MVDVVELQILLIYWLLFRCIIVYLLLKLKDNAIITMLQISSR